MKFVLALVLVVSAFSVQAHPFDKKLLGQIIDLPATEIKDKPSRIRKGRDLFFNETFNGNGRTCGTCHIETEAFTIDADFIRTLPRSDPLFVNETNPNLRELENSALLRGFGLICENLDGFDKPCVFRGVPHTLALPTSINPDPGTADRPPNETALGWSGDGSPGPLRNFVIGAIQQHFPRTLNRVNGDDFRLPTKQELNAMEAFQLSLGRRADVSLDDDNPTPALVFADSSVESGKALFNGAARARDGGTRACSGCHDDGGANDANGINRNFSTGVNMNPNSAACRGPAPGDGGLSKTPVTTATINCANGSTRTVSFSGNQSFNTPPLVEAADTGPFFHDNSSETIEDAIRFYASDAFNVSPSGNGRAFVFTPRDVAEIGALLRALNARQNVIDGISLNQNSKGKNSGATIARALSETRSAIRVLEQSAVPIYEDTTISDLLREAAAAENRALTNVKQRRSALETAIALKRRALQQFTVQ